MLILTPIEYKEKHDKIGHYIYICNYNRLLKSEKCYKHQPEPIREAKESTILSDFAIQTDRKIKAIEHI